MTIEEGAPKRDCFAYRTCNGRQWCDCCTELRCLHEKCGHYKPKKQYDEEYKKYGWERSFTEEVGNRHKVDGKLIKVMLEVRGLNDLYEAARDIGISYRSIYNAINKGNASKTTIHRLAEYFDTPEDVIAI